jgi:hypothetical protein
MEGQKICPAFGSNPKKPHQRVTLNLRRNLENTSIGMPTLLPHPLPKADVNSAETEMATIVIGAQWGDEVRSAYFLGVSWTASHSRRFVLLSQNLHPVHLLDN